MKPKRLTSCKNAMQDDDIVCSRWRHLAGLKSRARLTTLLNVKYAYGKKIFDKINDMMFPQFEDEEAINPYDFWDGADFKLKMRQVEGYPNYDKSEFSSPKPLLDGDEDKLKEVYDSMYSLQELLDPKNFKSYEELEAKFFRVIGKTHSNKPTTSSKAEEKIDESINVGKMAEEKELPETDTGSSDQKSEDAPENDDEDDLAFFKSLASS